MEAGMLLQPCLHLGVLVRAVVIHDQMQLPGTLIFLVDFAQEFQKLLMPVPTITLARHLSCGDLQRGEERGGAVANVIVSLSAAAPLFHWQTRLSPIQGLDLALLINAKHHRILWRTEINPDDIHQFRNEIHIA